MLSLLQGFILTEQSYYLTNLFVYFVPFVVLKYQISTRTYPTSIR